MTSAFCSDPLGSSRARWRRRRSPVTTLLFLSGALAALASTTTVAQPFDFGYVHVTNLSTTHDTVAVTINGKVVAPRLAFGSQTHGIEVSLKDGQSASVQFHTWDTDSLLYGTTVVLQPVRTTQIYYMGSRTVISFWNIDQPEIPIIVANASPFRQTLQIILAGGDTVALSVDGKDVSRDVTAPNDMFSGLMRIRGVDGKEWHGSYPNPIYIIPTDSGTQVCRSRNGSLVPLETTPVTDPEPRIRFANVTGEALTFADDTLWSNGSVRLDPLAVSARVAPPPGTYSYDVRREGNALLTRTVTGYHGMSTLVVALPDPYRAPGVWVREIGYANTPSLRISDLRDGSRALLEGIFAPTMADTVLFEYRAEGAATPLRQTLLAATDAMGFLTFPGVHVLDVSSLDGTLRRRFRFTMTGGEESAHFITGDHPANLIGYLLRDHHTDSGAVMEPMEIVPLSEIGGSLQIVNASRRAGRISGAIDGVVPAAFDTIARDAFTELVGEVGPDLTVDLTGPDGTPIHTAAIHIEPRQKVTLLVYDTSSSSGDGYGVIALTTPHQSTTLRENRIRVVNLEEQGRELDLVLVTDDTTLRFDDAAFALPTPYLSMTPDRMTIQVFESATGRLLFTAPSDARFAQSRTLVLRGSIETGTIELIEFKTMDGTAADTMTALGNISGVAATTPIRAARIAPNPAMAEVRVELELAESFSGELALYDINGARLLTRRLDRLASGRHAILLDVRELPSGHYFLHVDGDDGDRVEVGRVTIVR